MQDGSESEKTGDKTADGSESEKTADKTADARVLMGVIRVGLFAKRIMLDGDLLAELVVICAQKPTTSLLRRIATLMATEIVVTTLTLCDHYWCLLHDAIASIVSKCLNISSHYFHRQVATTFLFLCTKRCGNIPTGTS